MAMVKTKYQKELQARLKLLEEKHRNLLSAVTSDIRRTQYYLCLGKQTRSELDLQETNKDCTTGFNMEEQFLETGEKLIKKIKDKDFAASLAELSQRTAKGMDWKSQETASDDELGTIYFPSYCKRSPVSDVQSSSKTTAVEDLGADKKQKDSEEVGISVKEMFGGILEKYKKVYRLSEESSDSEESNGSLKKRSTSDDVHRGGGDRLQKRSGKAVSNSAEPKKSVRFTQLETIYTIQN